MCLTRTRRARLSFLLLVWIKFVPQIDQAIKYNHIELILLKKKKNQTLSTTIL